MIGLEEQDYETKLMMYMLLIRGSEEGHEYRYEEFAYLKRLPSGAIKIDHSFAQGLSEDVEHTAIVRMIMEAGPHPELLA
jgi:predicted signal transduction protein with EAL and GGDEF domain